ncbi:MAG TPA: adenylate/guanylate cyclase domain-containing protein [Urbifossiella sp.]|jgi:class 3 adenylate cyclase|nr:adenylate/guanylate cyclase domain-containing protein [Urbifossiella sp.]
MEQTPILDSADLIALVETAKALSAEIDLSDLLVEILKRAGQLTDSPAGSVLLFDREREALYFAAATGPTAATVLGRFGEAGQERIPIRKKGGAEYASVAGKVFDQGVSEVKDSVEADAGHFKGVDERTHHRTESMVCVPLGVGAERIGAMQLLNKQTGNYTPRDVVLLEHFAAHAGVAVRNAQHIRDLLAHKGLFTTAVGGRKAADLLAELSKPARRERMTVLFADMRGFTRFSQTLGDPQEILRYLNQFLTVLAAQVIAHDGLVNKFLGDGILALFRGDGYETSAVRCAFAITAEFAALRDEWNAHRNEDLTFLDVEIGIVTGNVIIGSIGSGRVKDFTVLGTEVNLAASFERDARNGQRVLIDQRTFNAVQGIVAEVDDPTNHELRKADQPAGVVFKRYHVRRLRPAVAAPRVSVGDGGERVERGGLQAYYSGSSAVVVGIDAYKSPRIGRLSYAAADARAVAAALPRAGFPPEQITLLLNEQASREAIQRAIYGKLTTTTRDDRLLVFFAQHGEVVKQHGYEEGYVLPYDADPTNLPLTALPMVELSQIGRRLPPKHILFVLDMCFSGYAAKRSAAAAPAAADLSALTREPVVQILTAETGDQKVIEEGGNGIFTRRFLKGLEGFADPDGSGLTAMKLAVYVQERVIAESDNRQTPQIAKLSGEGEFLFLAPRA